MIKIDNNNIVELECIHDRHKSFYKKAHVITDDKGNQFLRSYTTIVAMIKEGQPQVFGWFSVTTARHINEFLEQNGFDGKGKNEIEEAYPVKA